MHLKDVEPLQQQMTNRQMLRQMKVIELFREMDREVPAQLIVTFLYVAAHNPCYKTNLEKDLNFLTASCSRNIAFLSHRNRHGKPGLGLIRKETDPTNLRRLILTLTPKGEQLLQRIEDTL